MSPEMGAAIVAAYAELGHVSKDGQGNYGKHATISAVLDAAKPILSSHGLAVIQTFDDSDAGFVTVDTALVHTSARRKSAGQSPTPDGMP